MKTIAAGLLVWLGLLACAGGQPGAPRLELLPPPPGSSWRVFNSSLHTNAVLTLEVSTNLAAWESFATVHDALRAYPEVTAGQLSGRFFRLRVATRTGLDDWNNQILVPADPFCSTNTGGSTGLQWVKFAILLDEPCRVYYQDSRKYPFHYDFATHRLGPFVGLDRESFDALSLWRANQRVVLGSVLYPPAGSPVEYGVQFVGLDPYSAEEISRWFALIRATVCATNGAEALYLPTYEQSELARTNAEALAALGVPVGSVERWVTVNSCYAAGWALGRLKFFPGAEVAAAFSDGRLLPEDILLTDGVPADTPLVAGILSLTPSTPNSHTALLAQSFGTPFVYLPEPAEQARVQGLVGHLILIRATVSGSVAMVKVLDLDGLEPEVAAALRALKLPTPIGLTPKQPYGAWSAATDGLVPADIRYFGGKAANYGFLRRCVPTNCPAAIAFSFDLWDAFLDQTLPNHRTLRAEIQGRLQAYTNYPPPVPALKAELAAIRELFTKTARFTPAQQAAILAALARFDTRRNLRFRSSTNVEDSESFTGAGLYDSYSGCLLDDLDGDDSGPCQCDPAEAKERGVFRALQKVYASFYNDDAYLERLYHRVDEAQVGMGVLVHHSFPDAEELANGVATPKFSFSASATNVSGELVTQQGATSVTNPDGSALPEIVSISRYSPTIYSQALRQYSSLLPLGAYVLDWNTEYRALVEMFANIGGAFRQYYPAKNNFSLDFEYKKDARMGLVVKQVREVPAAAGVAVVPFLIDEPAGYVILQSENGNVFAYHRLKSLWTLHSRNVQLTPANLAGGLYAQGTLQYAATGAVATLSGWLNTWPNASNAPSGLATSWTTGTETNRWAWRLETAVTTNASATKPPVVTLTDFPKRVAVGYPGPRLSTTAAGGFTTSTNDAVDLQWTAAREQNQAVQQRAWTNGVATVRTSFYWQPSMITAPLFGFVETRISGLTPEPIVLTNTFAQSYRPLHHNWVEEFLFEPRLDPSLTPAQRAALEAAHIQMIYARYPAPRGESGLWTIGPDQKPRNW